jgi:diadenosine tetraphosphate (Ap4A) HIT family hydrolase
MPTAIHQKIRLAENGKNPNAIIRLRSGWVMMADPQPVAGYCILMSNPVAKDLNSMAEEKRIQYCLDMIRVGDALIKITGSHRINYETWCNLDPALHTHIVPRYMNEPDDKRILPLREAYDFKTSRQFDFYSNRDRDLIEKIRAELLEFAASPT